MSNQDSGRVSLEEDVVFGAGGGRELRCDVYTPPGEKGRAPAILLVHGGAWKFGDRKQLKGYGFLLGREGYVCVACEYRLSEEAQWPAPLHDVKAALRWMRANHEELGIDRSRIAVSGNSSGGHLALLAGATAGNPAFEGDGGNAGEPTGVAAAVAFYAPSELTPGAEMLKDLTVEFMGEGAGADDYAAASPVKYVGPDFPPTLIFQSNRDEIVPRAQSLNMCEALVSAGVPVELHLFDNVPHAFDENPALARQAVAIELLFLERYMPPADLDG